MDIILLPARIAETAYSLNKLYFESQQDCKHLIKRCLVVTKVLEPIQANKERIESCKEAVEELQAVLDDCLEFCKRHKGRNVIHQALHVLQLPADKEKFNVLNKRISSASDDLKLAISVSASMKSGTGSNNRPRPEQGRVSGVSENVDNGEAQNVPSNQSDAQLKVKMPTLHSSFYEDPSSSTVSCIVKWACKPAGGAPDGLIYQVQLGENSLSGPNWLNLGETDLNEFTIDNFAPDGELKIRVRAARCSSTVADGKASGRLHSWGPWSLSLVKNLRSVFHDLYSPNDSPRSPRSPRPEDSVQESEVIPSHADLCDACQKCKSAFSMTNKKYHCQHCGQCVCATCCPARLHQFGRKDRICLSCHAESHSQLRADRAPLVRPSAGLAYLASFAGLKVIPEGTVGFWTKGATSVIYKGTYNGSHAAIKLYTAAYLKVQMNADQDQPQMEERVYRLTSKCPYAVDMILCSTGRTIKHPFIATELLDQHGTLAAVLQNKTIELSWTWRLTALLQVAKFLVFLHGENYEHLDLKADNCIVTSVDQRTVSSADCVVKVFDFNSCMEMGTNASAELSKLRRTPTHSPPEFARTNFHQKMESVVTVEGAYDVFSFGILMAEVAARGLVYPNMAIMQSTAHMDTAMQSGVRPCLSAPASDNGSEKSGLPKEPLPKGYEDLARQCWDPAAEHRPSAAQVVAALEKMLQSRVEDAQASIPTSVAPTPIAVEVLGPQYIVVLNESSFKQGVLGASSTAKKMEKNMPNLRAYIAGAPDLQRYSFANLAGGYDTSVQYQPNTLYHRHAKDPNKYILYSQYAEHMLKLKEEEFKEIMHNLGAQKITFSNQKDGRKEVAAKAGVEGPPGGLHGEFALANKNERARNCCCTFEKPSRARPYVDKNAKYIFYDDWAGIVTRRTSTSPLNTETAGFSYSCEDSMAMELSLAIKNVGVTVKGSALAAIKVSESYDIIFYDMEVYIERNKQQVAGWSGTKIKGLLKHLKLDAYGDLFASKSIRGKDLLAEDLYVDLVGMGIISTDADTIVDAVRLQISGFADFEF